VERKAGFNVKLGRGGIREIEFIAQALQLAHGGRDDWLRVSHTLISLGRLADRGFISEQERTELSEAYYFLRTLEHRLQMEHGLQTHTIPEAAESRELLARRMGFAGTDAGDAFLKALRFQAGNVRRAYDRLFGKVGEAPPGAATRRPSDYRVDVLPDKDIALALTAANTFKSRLRGNEENSLIADQETLARELQRWAHSSLNAHRSLVNTVRVSASLDKSADQVELKSGDLQALTQLCGASDFFTEIIAANPNLISVLNAQPSDCLRRDHRAILRAAIDAENSFSAELAVLRLKWAELLTEIGALDARDEFSIFDTNRLQTELAVASVNVAYLVARREMARRFGPLSAGPRLAFLGFGRLGSGGVDYGSDLDLLITYDSMVPSPVSSLTRDEAYARLAELMIAALSSIKREGYLYRVDLRLRPHGQNGPLVQSSDGFLDYVKEDSAPWEWLAYVKLRAIGGDMELGKMIETHARHRIHANAQRVEKRILKTETRHVRDRLEREKGGRGRRTGTDIKYGPGGMLDVYFAVRYLQLRDEVLDEGEDRSTSFTLERLLEEGSLSADEFDTLSTGYSLLRSVDHNLRLVSGRSTHLPEPEHSTARDIAMKLGFESPLDLQKTLFEEMSAIRETYNRILGD
jgi:glutamate-ammonia-ligase adenylyltransferase